MNRLFLLTILCFLFGIAFSFGAEFRLDNEMQVEGSSQKVASTTFVLNSDFISLIGDNGEITFYDANKQIFTLLDPVLRVQTQLSAAETKIFVENLRQQIVTKPGLDPNTFNAFAVKPSFKEEFDEASGRLVLQSPWIDYGLTTSILTDQEAARQYFNVCDWLCYLNLRLDPHAMTMLIRLEVNRKLREGNRFASRITVAVFPKGKVALAQPDKAQSTHKIVMRLDDSDQKRIAQAREFRRTFTMLPPDDYQKKVADKKK